MNEVDKTLEALKAEQIAPLPRDFSTRILQEIERRKAQAQESLIDCFLAFLRVPSLAICVAILTLSIPIVMSLRERVADEASAVQHVLDLHVFSDAPPALPATLLTKSHE